MYIWIDRDKEIRFSIFFIKYLTSLEIQIHSPVLHYINPEAKIDEFIFLVSIMNAFYFI